MERVYPVAPFYVILQLELNDSFMHSSPLFPLTDNTCARSPFRMENRYFFKKVNTDRVNTVLPRLVRPPRLVSPPSARIA